MVQRTVGFAVGSALVALSACAHTESGTRNDNTGTPANGAVASNNAPAQSGQTGYAPDQTGAGQNPSGTAQNPNDMSGNSAGQPEPGATGGAAVEPAPGMPAPAPPSGQEAAGAPSDTGGNMGAAPGTPTTDTTAQDKNALISSADGSQPGTVQSFSNGMLTLTTHGKKHPTAHAKTIAVAQDVPVFQGATRVSTDAIVPGADVRVYWRTPSSGTERQVIAVDILNAGQGAPGANPDQTGNQGQGTSE